MTDLGICWTLATDPDLRLEAMRAGRVWRVRVPILRIGFTPSRLLYATGGLTMYEVMDLARTYRQKLLLCVDGCQPADPDRPDTYHRKPHLTDPDTVRAFSRELFEFVQPEGVEVYGVEVYNEAGYDPRLGKQATWADVKPEYRAYLGAYGAIEQEVSILGDVPLIVGGDNPRWRRNKQNGPPSLAWWMASEYGQHVAWHPSSRWTPQAIEDATKALWNTGVNVYMTEDVYGSAPDVAARGLAAQRGGAKLYCYWDGWSFEGWGNGWNQCIESGVGINHARREQVRELSMRLGQWQPDLLPVGEVQPGPEPAPEPGPSTGKKANPPQDAARKFAAMARDCSFLNKAGMKPDEWSKTPEAQEFMTEFRKHLFRDSPKWEEAEREG